MTKTAKIVLFGIVGFLAWRFYKKASTLGKLALSIASVGFQFQNGGILLTLFVNTINQEPEPVLINSLAGNISFNEQPLGNFKNDSVISIPANNTIVVPIQVFVLFQGIGEILASVLTGELKTRAVFGIDGTANIEGINFPVNINYSLV
jgi:hypothetical protein